MNSFLGMTAFMALVALSAPSVSQADQRKHVLCASCHGPHQDDLRTDRSSGSVCVTCHPSTPGDHHSSGMAMKDDPSALPLDGESKVTCTTCHESHSQDAAGKYLRMPVDVLCRSCH